MPTHYGTAGGSGLAAPALAAQGIPQPLGVGQLSTAPKGDELGELLAMLKGGQVGSDRFLELLSLLAGASLPMMDQMQGGPQMDPVEAAMAGQGAGPAGPAGPPDIQALMMGAGGY